MNQPGFAETSPKHSAPVLWGSWASLSLSIGQPGLLHCVQGSWKPQPGLEVPHIVSGKKANKGRPKVEQAPTRHPMISWQIFEWLRDRHLPALGHQK